MNDGSDCRSIHSLMTFLRFTRRFLSSLLLLTVSMNGAIGNFISGPVFRAADQRINRVMRDRDQGFAVIAASIASMDAPAGRREGGDSRAGCPGRPATGRQPTDSDPSHDELDMAGRRALGDRR